MRRRKKNHRAKIRQPKQRVQVAFEDLEFGLAGKKAALLGYVIRTNWFGASRRRNTLHVVVEDGTNDERLAEWWPGTGKAVLRTNPPEWTQFENAADLLDAAAGVRRRG